MDGPECNSDIATDGDFPGDGESAVEPTDEELGDDVGRHMDFLRTHNAALWLKSPHTRRN